MSDTDKSAFREIVTAAFEAWENEYRVNPDTFLTAEETAAMKVGSLSERRAITFLAYLRSSGNADKN